MKPDKLEQFVRGNRDEFDDMIPSPESWDEIKNNIRPVRKINWTSTMVRIAAAIVIFVASYIFIDYTVNRDKLDILAGQTDEELYEQIPVLIEARAYYSGQISMLEEEVYRMAGQESPIKYEIEQEFSALDTVFNELKDDLKDNAANQEVVEAMIQNYRLKLQILEEILYQLKSADQKNTVNDEDNKVIL